MSKKKTNLLLTLFGILIICLLIRYCGTENLHILAKPNLGLTVIAVLCLFITYTSAGIRWGIVVNTMQGKKVTSYLKYIFYHNAALFSSIIITGTGASMIAKPALLKLKEGQTFETGIIAAILEKSMDLLIIFVHVLPVILYYKNYISDYTLIVIIIVSALVSGSLFVVLNRPIILYGLKLYYFIVKGINKFYRLIRKKPHKQVEDQQLYLSSDFHIPYKTVINITILSFSRYFSYLATIYFIGQMYHLNISLVSIMTGVPIIQLVSTFGGIIPGSLGVAELGWFGILTAFSTPANHIPVFLIARRFWLTIFSVITFLGFTILIRLHKYLFDAGK